MFKEYKSISKNYFANVFGLGVTFFNQIAMVPIFIKFWGVERFGDWILITALSSVFTMTNLGINQATNNEFVIKYQHKKLKACNKLLINSFIFISIISLISIFIAIITAYFFSFKDILFTKTFNDFQTNVLFILLLFNIFIKMYSGVYNGIYRVISKAHVSAMIENIIRLFEIIVLLVGVILDIDIIVIITLYNIPSLLGIIFKHYETKKYFKINFCSKDVDLNVFKSIIRPSMGFMLIPMGLALSNQGMIFVISGLLGSTILVIFSTTRTIVNFLKSALDLLGNSIHPEISVAYGRNDTGLIQKIFYRALIVNLLTGVIIVLLLVFFGKFIYLFLTNYSIHFNDYFFFGMIAVLVVTSISKIFSVLLLATNRHSNFAIFYLITQMLGVLFSYLSIKLIFTNISAIPIVLFFTESILLVITIKEVNKIFKLNLKNKINIKKIVFK
jgi:O-antigen/teichoic acid export membrane protein